jgi:serine/threonine protein kinase
MGDDDLGLITDLEEAWCINFDDLEFAEQLGEGAFGAVHKGTYFGTEVAIKRLFQEDDSPDTELFIQREINVLQGMRHPNIVQFIGIARHPTKGVHIVTELIKAGDLRKLLKNPKNKLTWLDKAKIAHSAACAMAYLHSRNIIHRDLKSKNLLVEDGWRVKICDFGFARTTVGKGARPMTLCGTDDWMAPEIILGYPYSGAADVFSFGIVLCEIITRKKISQDLQRSPMDAFGLSVEKFKKIIPADCPPDFSILAIECCAHEPEQRPTFAQVVSKLKILMRDIETKEKEAKANTNAPESVTKFQDYAARLAQMKKAGGATTTTTARPATNTTAINNTARASPTIGAPVSRPTAPVVVKSPVVAPVDNRRAASNKWSSLSADTGNQTYVASSRPVAPASTPAARPVATHVAAPPKVATASSSNTGGVQLYSYDTLRNNTPEGIDRNDLPRYLHEDEFLSIFGMSKTAFYAMPAWKQRGRKRELNLF